MNTEPSVGMSKREMLEKLFLEDFTCLKDYIAKALGSGSDKSKLFEMILCDCLGSVKRCEDIKLKTMAVNNMLMALEQIGEAK